MANAVMVPLDGSSFAEAALPQGVALAARMDATLHLVRVQQYHTVRIGTMLQAQAEDPDALEFYLGATVDRVRRIFAGPIVTKVLHGPVVEALEEYATEQRIAIMALSTHGRRGLARMRLGSVADALLHRLRIPVLVVRPPAAGADEGLITPIAPGCREVLVALDGSSLAAAMLPTAEALAATWRVPLTLVHVIQPPLQNLLPGVEYVAPLAADPVLLDTMKDTAAKRLEPLLDALRLRGADARAVVEVAASPADGLCAVAERTPGAVLALATHGFSGFRRLMRGSVADQILHRAPVPLLVWRPASAQLDGRTEREAVFSH